MDRNVIVDNILTCINKINPSEEQLIDAFDSIIAIKENEVLMEASPCKRTSDQRNEQKSQNQ